MSIKIEDLKSNSNCMKDEPEKVKKVTTGEVRVKKKGTFSKVLNTFLSDDKESIKTYIIFDIIVPGIKNMISDMITNSIDMLLFDGKRSKQKSHIYTNYNNIYRSNLGGQQKSHNSRVDILRRGMDIETIIFPTRLEAERVLDSMFSYIQQYKEITVGDYYDMVGITSQFTDEKWGWTDLSGSRVKQTRDGYILELPRITNL